MVYELRTVSGVVFAGLLQSFVNFTAFTGLFSLRVYPTSSGDLAGHELFPKRRIRDICSLNMFHNFV